MESSVKESDKVSLPSISNDGSRSTITLTKKVSYFDTKKYVLPTLHPELQGYQPGEFTLRVTADVSKGLCSQMDKIKRKQAASHLKRMNSLAKSISRFDEILQERRRSKNMRQRSSVKTATSNDTLGSRSVLSRFKKESYGKLHRKTIDGSGQMNPMNVECAESEDSYKYAASDNLLLSNRNSVSRSPSKKCTKQQVEYIFGNGSKPRTQRQYSEGGAGNLLKPSMPQIQGSRRASLVSIKELERYYEAPRIRFQRFGEARAFFAKVIKRIMNLLFWWEEFSRKYETVEARLKTFLDMAEELTETTAAQKYTESTTGLRFDPRFFKASKEYMFTKEVLLILCTRPHQRTEEQVRKVIRALQGLKSYAEYPLHMQVKLARVAFYQQVSPKRVILRQGHTPENFYFILAGTALVKVITSKDGQSSVNVVTKLKKGQSFGEIALLHDSVRTATVESLTDMKLLTIYKDDFLDIFFNMKNGEDPEHITFCREIPFLKDWPLDELIGDPSNCVFHYFRRGSVVVPDSQKNDWIYIVKSGSCRVLKRLNEVDAYKSWKHGQSLDSTDYQNRVNVSSEQVSKIDSGRLSQRVLAVKSPVGRAMTTFFMTSSKLKLQSDFQSRKSKSSVSFNKGSKDDEAPNENEPLQNTEISSYEKQNEENDVAVLPEPKSRNLSTTKEIPDLVNEKQSSNNLDIPGYSKSQFRSFMLNCKPHMCSLPMIKKHPPSGRTNQYIHSSKSGQPCYITLKKLRPKDVFGLEDVQFEDEQYDNPKVSVILVSDGSELVMISKKKFSDHANEFVRQYVREHVVFYPEDNILQRSLQTEVNWDLYKKHNMEDTVNFIQDLKTCS